MTRFPTSFRLLFGASSGMSLGNQSQWKRLYLAWPSPSNRAAVSASRHLVAWGGINLAIMGAASCTCRIGYLAGLRQFSNWARLKRLTVTNGANLVPGVERATSAAASIARFGSHKTRRHRFTSESTGFFDCFFTVNLLLNQLVKPMNSLEQLLFAGSKRNR